MTKRWNKRPQNANWGDFGADDELGRVNLLTPEKVLQGVAEVRAGLSFCLSLPLELPGGNTLNPNRYPPILEATVSQADGKPRYLYPLEFNDGRFTDVVCDDKVSLTCQYSTQWDALCHMGGQFDATGDGVADYRFYNGYQGGTDIIGPVDHHLDGTMTDRSEPMGARKLGIENLAKKGMQGRGVMVDLFRHHGNERVFVGYDLLMAAMESSGAEIEPGDMLVLYTGFADHIVDAQGNPDEDMLHNSCAVLDGRDEKLQQWIIDSGLAVICADNYAVEGLPARPGPGETFAGLPLHELCLFKLGINLGELWYLRDLANWLHENDRTRFLLTAPPLRLTGAVGSPVTPIATV